VAELSVVAGAAPAVVAAAELVAAGGTGAEAWLGAGLGAGTGAGEGAGGAVGVAGVTGLFPRAAGTDGPWITTVPTPGAGGVWMAVFDPVSQPTKEPRQARIKPNGPQNRRMEEAVMVCRG
jgi:hypothetical protein